MMRAEKEQHWQRTLTRIPAGCRWIVWKEAPLGIPVEAGSCRVGGHVTGSVKHGIAESSEG